MNESQIILSGTISYDVEHDQQHEEKLKPSKQQVQSALNMLNSKWDEIVGSNLAQVTMPVKFTGHKMRRLVIHANPDHDPPWGSWVSIRQNKESKAAFSRFRGKINDAITPLEVDTIDFITESWSVRKL